MNPADRKMEDVSMVLEIIGRDFKEGNVKSLAVARGGGDWKRFSVSKMEFPTHYARSKMNLSTTKTSVCLP